jgi:rhodanese-related sulfurtransferase/thiol-disulfide isomerase/thioredoxin
MLPLGLAFLLLLSACGANGLTSADSGATDAQASDSAQTAASGPDKISAEEAYARMNSGDPIVVVDVRTAEEYAETHIPGAILIPNEEIGTQPPAGLPVLNAEILVYCRSGNRSAQAVQKLADMGYTNLSDFGGIEDWPYETESGEYQVPQKEGTLSSFSAYDLNGVPVDESLFGDDQLTMINIWGTFCGPCLREMPELGQLAADYAERGVQIVGIVVDVPQSADGTYTLDMVETVQALVAQTGANYRHLLPSADLVSAKLSEVSAVPETIFVDRQGKLVGESYVGSRSGEDWSKIIDSLLEEAAA